MLDVKKKKMKQQVDQLMAGNSKVTEIIDKMIEIYEISETDCKSLDTAKTHILQNNVLLQAMLDGMTRTKTGFMR